MALADAADPAAAVDPATVADHTAAADPAAAAHLAAGVDLATLANPAVETHRVPAGSFILLQLIWLLSDPVIQRLSLREIVDFCPSISSHTNIKNQCFLT